MELEIQKQRETPLLARRRITAMVNFQKATPSRANIRDGIAKKLNVNDELVIVRHIYTKYGKNEAKVIAHVYKDNKFIEKLEGKALLEKHGKKAKEGKEEADTLKEAPAETKKEENKPTEENKK
ncbi:MAG: hypothetical protein ABIG89_02495 [Candidatus Woesearchaeota archaeon]